MDGRTDFSRDIGILEGKQDMIIQKLEGLEDRLCTIEEKISRIEADLARVKERASLWGAITGMIVSALVTLGLKKM